jgi:hypothetical protein
MKVPFEQRRKKRHFDVQSAFAREHSLNPKAERAWRDSDWDAWGWVHCVRNLTDYKGASFFIDPLKLRHPIIDIRAVDDFVQSANIGTEFNWSTTIIPFHQRQLFLSGSLG